MALKYKKSGSLFEGQAGVEKTKPHKFESQFISSRTGLQLSKEDFLRLQTNSGKSGLTRPRRRRLRPAPLPKAQREGLEREPEHHLPQGQVG